MRTRALKMIVLLAALSLTLTGCRTSTSNTGTEAYEVSGGAGTATISELIDLSDRLHFPEVEAANEILLSETGYIEMLSEIESKYYKIDKAQLVKEWTVSEKDKMIKLTMEFENSFEEHGIGFDESINMVKISGDTNLPPVFISDNAIIMTQSAVDTHKDALKDEMVQAIFRLYLAQHPDTLVELSASLGFKPVKGLQLSTDFIEHIVIRPGINQPFLYEAKRADVETSPVYRWIPVSVINSEKGQVEDYMLYVTLSADGTARDATMTSVNKYLPEIAVFNNHMLVPLSELESSYRLLGEIPDRYSHPEDILALNFMYLVLDRPVTGTGTIDKLREWFEVHN